MTAAQRLRFLALVAGSVLVLLLLRAWLRPDATRRNLEFAPDMADSPAYEAYSAHPGLAGGASLQPLVAGVVPRGFRPFPFGSGEEEAARAGVELRNPVPREDAAQLERGRVLYGIHCAVCHGLDGTGRTPVTMRGMLPPPSLLAERASGLPDGQLFHILTRGQGNMASYAAQLDPAQRWQVVNWIRSLQEASP